MFHSANSCHKCPVHCYATTEVVKMNSISFAQTPTHKTNTSYTSLKFTFDNLSQPENKMIGKFQVI